MASVNKTRPHCVNQMGKTHSKPIAARHAMCESAFKVPSLCADGRTVTDRRLAGMRPRLIMRAKPLYVIEHHAVKRYRGLKA
jgi:hypothetical protein